MEKGQELRERGGDLRLHDEVFERGARLAEDVEDGVALAAIEEDVDATLLLLRAGGRWMALP